MWFSKVSNAQVVALQAAIGELHVQIKVLREDHEQLAAAHERLRGRWYAAKGTSRVESADPLSKAEALKAFGVVPGRPTLHK